jgi:MoxR-like ATPase
LLAAQHAVLLGPPGTAKSALARALCGAIDGAKFFERLLTKFTTPEEIFGPMSLAALERDEFRRVTKGKLPEAHIAFLDETFKANSAILNSLLTAMNERVFHNGNGAPVSCPLISLIGASNEMPEDESLAALFDRFTIRFYVGYIGDRDKRRAMLTSAIDQCPVKLSLDELDLLQHETTSVKISNDALDAMLDAADDVSSIPVSLSDRRVKQSVDLVKASALLAGRSEVDPEDDLMILTHAWWHEPGQIAKVRDTIGKRVSPLTSEARELLDAAHDATKSLIDGAPRTGASAQERNAWVAQAVSARGVLNEMYTRLDERIATEKKSGARTRKAELALDKIEGLADQLAMLTDKVLTPRRRRSS